MSIFSREMVSFVEIARAQSLRQAAQELNISASALSRQMSILEREVGAQLMIRLPGGMRLTPNGLTLLQQADRWIEDEVRMRLELRSQRTAGTLTFRLGIMECLGNTLIPDLSQKLQVCGPLANCSLTIGDSTTLLAQLASGAQDAIVAFNVPRQKDIHVWQEWDYRIGLVCPPAWLQHKRRTISLRECLSWPLLLPASPLSSHARLHAEITRQRENAKIVLQTNSVDVLRRLVASLTGITFLTHLDVMNEVAGGELAFVPLSDRRLTERLSLCTLGGAAVTPELDSLIKSMAVRITSLGSGLRC